MPFSPEDFLGVSLEVDGNTGIQSLSAGVGGGDNVGVSVTKKHLLMKGLIQDLALVSSKFCLSAEIKVRECVICNFPLGRNAIN